MPPFSIIHRFSVIEFKNNGDLEKSPTGRTNPRQDFEIPAAGLIFEFMAETRCFKF